jgi:hypothetical protein
MKSLIKTYAMKSLLKFLTITFFALLVFTSCQDEIIEETSFNEQELITASSPLASLMQSTSARDGRVDNILDNANCLSVNLPVTVIVNGITITINTLHDLELIEAIFEEFENDDDILELLFPITIVLNDHEEIVINNQDELNAFVDQCTDDSDDDIECIDFLYPISFSIYDTSFQIIETVVIENDRELHEFLERLEHNDSGALLVSLDFPVTMVYANGETVEVHNNQELSRVLNDAQENCDDEETCRKEVVDMYLQECYWKVDEYNDSDDLDHYNLYFKQDGVFKVKNAGEILATGVWNTTSTDVGIVINISELSDLNEELGGDWLVIECDEDEFELVREASGVNEVTHMEIEKECEDDLDCSAQEVRNFFKECQWFAGSNLFDDVPEGEFYFEEDHVLVVVNINTNEEIVGTWSVELTDEGIILVIDLPAPYDVISKRWKISECGEHRVKMISGDYYLVFERECDTDCTEQDVDAYLLECVWNVVIFNGDDNLISYDLEFNNIEGITITDTATNETYTGFWSTSQANDGVLIQFANINGPNIQEISGDWIVVSCESGRLELQNNSNVTMVLEQNCD